MIDLSDTSKVKQLVDACIKGDRRSLKLFYQTFFGKMIVVCMRYADNREEARDIVHDGFIKVFQYLPNFKFKGSLEGWIKKIMINTAIDAIRNKKAFFVELDDDKNYEEYIEDYSENAEYEELNQIKVDVILKMIQQLTPAYRTVLNLYIFEEMSHKEIAEMLNINIGTSKSNYSKARRNLIKMVEDYYKRYEQ